MSISCASCGAPSTADAPCTLRAYAGESDYFCAECDGSQDADALKWQKETAERRRAKDAAPELPTRADVVAAIESEEAWVSLGPENFDEGDLEYHRLLLGSLKYALAASDALERAREQAEQHDDAHFGCESMEGARAAMECRSILENAPPTPWRTT